ncbi:hypothetical protein SAM40697_0207 [Streptomyces ambofaciens]|uniref:Uncharacterized protein n=1 Tax=Streptomyces ambofaciens TaxID=1889 RepID=A0ABM6ASI1_STRAM|nr:hypothetical protein SAM40697_0207 [Streptomyces ambofaciens]
MDQVGHGLAVTGQNGIDEEVGDAQHRIIEAESPGQIQRVECFLIGLDDSTGVGMRTADRHPAAVGGGVRLLGEVGQHFLLSARSNAQESAVLGREQDVAVPEPRQQSLFHLARDAGTLFVGGGALSDGDRVGVRQAQSEALGPFGESAKVASSVEQVVDELASCRFFLPYCERKVWRMTTRGW